MDKNLAIQLSEQALSVLTSQASAVGKTPAELASSVVESIYGGDRVAVPDANAARAQFEHCFGSVDLGRPIGISNDAIDSDLAQEYHVISRPA